MLNRNQQLSARNANEKKPRGIIINPHGASTTNAHAASSQGTQNNLKINSKCACPPQVSDPRPPACSHQKGLASAHAQEVQRGPGEPQSDPALQRQLAAARTQPEAQGGRLLEPKLPHLDPPARNPAAKRTHHALRRRGPENPVLQHEQGDPDAQQQRKRERQRQAERVLDPADAAA